MRKNVIPVLLASAFLVGCNGFKTIDEATAIQRAADIVAHQKAEGFAIPDCFTAKFHNHTENVDSKGGTQGGIITTYDDLTRDFVFNLKTYSCYEHNIQITVDAEGLTITEDHVYHYYDKSKSTYYNAFENNGVKGLDERPNTTEEDALKMLNARRNKWSQVLKYQQVLGSFKQIVDGVNEMKERFKDSKEEFARIDYASKNDKSLKVDYGYKYKESIEVEEIGTCDGFHSYDEVAAYDNDLLLNREMNTLLDYENKKQHYTTSLYLHNDIEIKQSKGDIKLPNFDDYR